MKAKKIRAGIFLNKPLPYGIDANPFTKEKLDIL